MLENKHSSNVGNYWTIFPESELPGCTNPANVKMKRWSVKFGYLWADNRFCYWHTHYQRPYISLFCLTLTIVLQGLERTLLTPELTSRRRIDCSCTPHFVEIGKGHIFLKGFSLFYLLKDIKKSRNWKLFTKIRQIHRCLMLCSPG